MRIKSRRTTSRRIPPCAAPSVSTDVFVSARAAEYRQVPFQSPDESPDITTAVHYADIVGLRERAGRPMSAADAQIAAITRSHGATLATRNTDDFTDTAITIINPWTNPSD